MHDCKLKMVTGKIPIGPVERDCGGIKNHFTMKNALLARRGRLFLPLLWNRFFAPQDMMQGLFSCSHISVILLCKKKEGLRAVKLGASRYPLKKVFYRTFSLLVVVPLILVSVAAAIILYRVMRSSTVDTISAFQETVATTLDNDIRSASLQLSHFVYVNDGEFLDVVNQVYQSTGSSQQYLANKTLERSFNTAMVPSQNILAGRFFMKSGGAVSVKDAITLPDEEMRAEGW